MGLLTTLLLNPVVLVAGIYYYSRSYRAQGATRIGADPSLAVGAGSSAASLPQRARLMGVSLGRMVSFVSLKRRDINRLIKDNAEVLEVGPAATGTSASRGG